MSQRTLWFLGLALVAGGSLPGCTTHPDPWADAGTRKRVVVTFAPLDSFVKKVGGDRVAVVCLTTVTGPHHYDYHAKETIAVRGADLFLANGLGLDESFADKLHNSSANAKLEYVKVGEVLEEQDKDRKKKDKLLIPAEKVAGEEKGKGEHDHGHGHGHEHGHHHGEGEWDPHIWLGFASTAPGMVDIIRDALKKIDPDNAAEYDRNAVEFRKELLALGSEAKNVLADKKDKDLLTFHDSLRYLARDLDLKIAGSVEIVPGRRPTEVELAALIKLCEQKKIKYIATEPQYPPTEAKLIKDALDKKVKVKLIPIDPLETANPADLGADWYLMQMKKTIETLEKELE